MDRLPSLQSLRQDTIKVTHKNEVSGPELVRDKRRQVAPETAADFAVYLLDPNGIITNWNASAQRLEGYNAAEVVGTHFSRFYTGVDHRAGAPENALAIAKEMGRFEAEGWQARKDGTRFRASVVIDAIRDASGQLVGFAKITRDLSERKAADEALRQSEEQFRLLVQGITDYALIMLDERGNVSTWNIGAQRINGYLPHEIIGKHVSTFYTVEDRAAGQPEAALGRAAREGRFEKEGWRVRKDGSRFWANVVIDAIKDPGGKIIGFAKITRDITEKREREKSLEEAREAFFQAQKFEALGQLTGGMAHDFNNLLTVISSSLELLGKRVSDETSAKLVDNAFQAARRGASLTQRMLAFARRQQLDQKSLHLPRLVLDMAELLKHTIGPEITFKTVIPTHLPMVLTDPHHLESALLNLAVNARDAMPKGGVITISAREEYIGPGHFTALPEGRYVCLAVQDEGQGMTPETLARATEPFYTTKGVGKGTGLGLSMVQGFAAQSGGCLVLTSIEGQGTTAEIWLRTADIDMGAVAHCEQPAGDTPKAEVLNRPIVILAVDDDPLVLMNTATMLEDLGHKVWSARSGEMALDILEKSASEIDLVITDQAMPHLSGLQLAEKINAAWPAIPVIMATGYANLSAVETKRVPELPKPFSQRQLQKAIAEAMQNEVLN
jgi:PAS domain S-box-containing protein